MFTSRKSIVVGIINSLSRHRVVCTEIELKCFTNYLATTAVTRDTQHVELAQQHCIQPEGQHFGLTHWNSMGFCITFKVWQFLLAARGSRGFTAWKVLRGCPRGKKSRVLYRLRAVMQRDGRKLSLRTPVYI